MERTIQQLKIIEGAFEILLPNICQFGSNKLIKILKKLLKIDMKIEKGNRENRHENRERKW